MCTVHARPDRLHWKLIALIMAATPCHHSATVRGKRGREKASDIRHLAPLLILFLSSGKLVVRQTYLPNNSKNQSFVRKPEAQYSCFWPREDASQHRRLAGCDESRPWAARVECDDKEEIVPLNSGPESLWSQSPPAADNLFPF